MVSRIILGCPPRFLSRRTAFCYHSATSKPDSRSNAIFIRTASANLRYAAGLRRFLREPITPADARRLVTTQLAGRNQAFLRIAERSIYGHPRSPYLPLLRQAGIELADLRAMVEQSGLKGALDRLYDAGVYMTLDEFKARTPIRRGNLKLEVSEHDFDNPTLASHFEGTTSGSRGVASRILLDLDFLASEAAHVSVFLGVWGALDRPTAVWRSPPPGADGVRAVLRFAKLGMMPRRWFAPNIPAPGDALRASVFTNYTLLASRLIRRPIPRPQLVMREDAVKIARWLAEAKAQGTPALLNSNASPATRICLAAQEHGLDISGTTMIPGGEPFTGAKASIFAATGVQAAVGYAMQELGTVSFGCPAHLNPDDQHVLGDKVEFIQRARETSGGQLVNALIYTGLLATCPKVMLNVESGDYADVSERDCGCGYRELGLTTILSNVRSYEKLTSEGVSFIGAELYDLLEAVLPARFGGQAMDYQLVEEETDGLPCVSIVVSPSVGAIDESALIAAVLDAFRSYSDGGRTMAEQWRQANTLRVVRREPYVTGTSKVLPLHIQRSAATSSQP